MEATTKKNALYAAISRRRALALGGTGLVGVAAAALIGCSSSSKESAANKPAATSASSAPPVAAKPKRGGMLKYPAKSTPNSLDPYRSETGNSGPYLEYSKLFSFEAGDGVPASGKVIGDLVQTWEQPDPLTTVVHLNPAAKWDEKEPLNGRRVTAEDVVASWKRYEKEDSRRTILANSTNPQAPIVDMKAIDASTVQILYKFAYGPTLAILATEMRIQPAEGIAGKIDLAKTPRGNGPFLLEEYKSGVSFTYKRNPTWHLGGGERPYVDGILIPIIPNTAQQEVQFRAKNLHLGAVSRPNMAQFAKDLPDTSVVVGARDVNSPTCGFSYSPGQPWHDVRVRRAVSMATDRDVFADVILNPKLLEPFGAKLTVRWNAPIAAGYGAFWLDPKSPQFGPAAQYLQYNIAEATKMLAAAGYTAAKPLEFDNIGAGITWGLDYPKRQEVMQSMVQKTGVVKMNIVNLDWATDGSINILRTARPGNYGEALFKGRTTEAAVHLIPGGASVDPLVYYKTFLAKNGASSITGAHFPVFDGMLQAQHNVTKFEDRVAGMHELNRWATDNMTVWPVGPATEGVDLIWKALRGPERYRAFVETSPGLSGSTHVTEKHWFEEAI